MEQLKSDFLHALNPAFARMSEMGVRYSSIPAHTEELSEAIDIAIRSLVNPGDEVSLPTPSFVCYEPIAKMCGAKVVTVETFGVDYADPIKV